ncbi:MAG: TetR/AcrR family transcriptional regulator [Pseudomonadota bacterium]
MGRHKAFEHDQVLDKAMRLFWRKGYEATSVQELVSAMGINRASLYDSFGDKHDLFMATIDHYVEHVSHKRLAKLKRPGPPLEILAGFFDDLIAVSLGRERYLGCFLTNSAVELAPHDRIVEQRLRLAIGNIEESFYVLLCRAQSEGTLDPRRDARALARYLTGAVQGLRVLIRAKADPAVLHDVVRVTLAAVEQDGGP